MDAHQVITGALNSGENVYALGNIEGLTFTACAVGSDVVILDADFSRVQVIPDNKNRVIVTSLSCCQETGKIAVTYGNSVRILEATSSEINKQKLKSLIFQFTWVETHSFKNKDLINSVLWTMEGMRLLFVIGNKLVLHQHRNVNTSVRPVTNAPVPFYIAEEEAADGQLWEIIWQTLLPFKPEYIRYSPDGYYLALSGGRDCFIKIFYQNGTDQSDFDFSAVTLNHPAPVCGFEWRKTGRYMPKKCINSILISWCEDRTSRIWKESPPPEASIIDLTGEGGGEPLWERQKTKKFFGKNVRVKKTRTKIINTLRSMISEKRHDSEDHAIGLRAQVGKSPSSLDFQAFSTIEHKDVQFYLAATINANSDCLLVPSFDEFTAKKPFCVHWLNNKELVFSVGAEKLLAEAVLMDIESSVVQNMIGPPEKIRKLNQENQKNCNEKLEKEHNTANSVCSETPSSKDILDVKLEILLRQWTKSSDVLFSLHPIDGSLLTWTVDWLDDNYRQPVVSYSSRLPGALPPSDSLSLHSKLSTFNPHEPVYLDALRNEVEVKDNALFYDKLLERRVSNTIHVLTSHDNGTLNLWHMSVDEQSSFCHVMNMTHISRMCGHRFQMQQIIAHPVLPLLLTTSKFTSFDTLRSPISTLSEVILWKITPVGPLCINGGVKELARVASPSISGFSSVGWVPAILPSLTLGSICNSPSSCFISCDGNQLVIYQAVLDARGLLSEITNAKHHQSRSSEIEKNQNEIHFRSQCAPSFINEFNIISTQSTAKPGCVLEVGRIEDINLEKCNLIFLHVFQSSIVIADKDIVNFTHSMSSVIDRSRSAKFTDNFFIVMIDRKEKEDVIMMFSLTISSQSPQTLKHFNTSTPLTEITNNTPSREPAPSVAKLSFDAKLVCHQTLPIPDGTRITSVTPAAGHLSSSSLYPACETPYVFVTSDNDESVRFWRCIGAPDDSKNEFEWHEWNMISENHPSELGLEGRIVCVTAAHSGRIACAYEKSSQINVTNASIEVAVFECESSGGVEWFREDSFTVSSSFSPQTEKHFENQYKSRSSEMDIVDSVSNKNNNWRSEDLVNLDWVSTEDGSHILTVGMATNVFIYTKISQDPSQQNVTLMKDSETSLRRPSIRKASSLIPNIQPHSRFTRWVCCRVLALDSADGLPPIPTTLNWVRDGILIVGMKSEMRVYNQWNFATVDRDSKEDVKNRAINPEIVCLTVSTSHSMLDQMNKKKEALASNRSRIFLDLVNTVHRSHPKEIESQMVLDILRTEGVFETARMCSPILPQYHPKQLIVLLNAGKKKRVKAILNHVLFSIKKQKNAAHNSLSRAPSKKRFSTVGSEHEEKKSPLTHEDFSPRLDDDTMDYNEIDDIPLLPLYALMEVDDTNFLKRKQDERLVEASPEYHDLFENETNKDSNIDDLLRDNESLCSSRSRNISGGSDAALIENSVSTNFSFKDYRKLTELLTHTHLPGLSSVDQMHLLAIADTLSHFASDEKDKVEQANAAMQPVIQSVLGDATAGGYATAAAGMETVDECGLKYLMAMKQHEYLLVCLPMKQRMELKKNGLSAANVIWAQHSETETELLNAVPGMQKANPSWEELRGLGIAWWLKNTSSLRICIEKLAKAAFQQNQDPMDASLFYLALRKKNILTHLFKTVRNQTMSDFFMNDFHSDHWKKVAAKNAFVLMSKQRFQHAAAFFLLSGSLRDAVQTILTKCNDLQLGMVIVRLYENDIEKQQQMINDILCREVLGISSEEFENQRSMKDDEIPISIHASKEPFERSMAFWIMKNYTRAADTLVQEAQYDRHQSSLADIFNFYSFLRKHPLVVRQRLSNAGAQIGSTEKFLALGKQLERILTPPERRLFFRTSAEHMSRGCPMLTLDVLTLLPKRICLVQNYDEALKALFNAEDTKKENRNSSHSDSQVDWSAPIAIDENDELKLEWSDDEADNNVKSQEISQTKQNDIQHTETNEDKKLNVVCQLIGSRDIFAQHMKFVASLQIMTEELSTLASGFEVGGGELRQQLLYWLEKEISVLKSNCNYNLNQNQFEDHDEAKNISPEELNLTTITRNVTQSKPTSYFSTWLASNQKLVRSFISFCTLHSAHNHKLVSVLMELLLLLLNAQRNIDSGDLSETQRECVSSFPLLDASVFSPKMFVPSPLAFLENQCSDLLISINQFTQVPNMTTDLKKCYMLYNLSQGFSWCVYQSLSNNQHKNSQQSNMMSETLNVASADDLVTTPPVKWPGVDNLIALLGREKDEDAPQLQLLIVESFLAIEMSIFCFALSAYDVRWLYRLSAHEIDPNKFGSIFGGGGEHGKSIRPPSRPPKPAPSTESVIACDGDYLRRRLNLKVLGNDSYASRNKESTGSTQNKWIPPSKNIVQLLSEKPHVISVTEDTAYESDEEDRFNSLFSDEEEDNSIGCENASTSSFPWQLLRLALIQQQLHRVKQFLVLAGFDPEDIPNIAPRIDSILRRLNCWQLQQEQYLKNFPGGVPNDILPDMTVDTNDQALATTMRKYSVLVKSDNTPFESDDRKIQLIKRLWLFLVREDHLQDTFIKHIFSQSSIVEKMPDFSETLLGIENSPNLPEAFKIIQRDGDPIVAFSCNQDSPGLIVVSNGSELQEMDMSDVFKDQFEQASWMWNRAELDMKNIHSKQDALRDNDDYQFFTNSASFQNAKHANIMMKRHISGVRRIDSHPHAPFYVTGSSDGSIRVWKWGAKGAIYTARIAGQHAKVSKIAFSCNGNKFAAVDGDGMLCLWQASQSTEQKKPFFSQRCHNKCATDVRFLGHSSSVLLTAGSSSLDYNLGLWDTLLPTNRALVHSWVAHPEGATCALYSPSQQTIFSGGHHGEICLWDVRQRQLRQTIKAFDPMHTVKALVTDLSQDLIVAGSSEGDIKIWSADSNPQLMYTLPGEHATKGGFSFRQVGQSSVQGVQQMFVDQNMRLFSCGADASLKFRTLPSIFNMTHLL